MLDRDRSSTLFRPAAGFPVIAVTGPRQSGKTTLVKDLFPEKPYVSLEDPEERAFAEDDPKGFPARFHEDAIFNEAQRRPALFSWLQGLVDTDRQPGGVARRSTSGDERRTLSMWDWPVGCSAFAMKRPWPFTP
ncbi:MAG: hypothetical protein C0462_00850 [Alcanivorax sp.]|nr:hypothetical protein [Alcanivorax sp.]